MASGTALVQVVGLLSAPITARVFAPAETGISAVFLNLVAIFAGLAFLRFEQALPLPRTREERVALIALCLAVLPGTVGLVLLMIFLGRHWIADLLNEPGLAAYLWLLPLAVALAGVTQMLTNWFTRENEFGTIVRTRLRQSFGQIGFQLSVGALTHGNAWVLIWGGVLGNSIAVAGYLCKWPGELWQTLRGVSLKSLRSLARAYHRFPLYNSWASFIDTLAPTIPVFVLTSLHGAQATGWYRMAQLLVTVPVTAISNAVMNVYWSEAARLAHEDPIALKRLYRRITLRLAGLGGLLILGSLSLPLLVPPVFGARWGQAGTYAVVMSVPAAFGLMSTPAVNLSTLNFNHWEAAWVSFRIVLIGLATWTSWAFQLSALATLGAFAAVLTIGYVLLILLNFKALQCFASRPRQMAGTPSVEASLPTLP